MDIDVKLVEKAKPTNRIIEEIDFSWREYIKRDKQNIVKLPFKDTYNAIIKDEIILVEGYSGLLSIEKIFDGKDMYKIISPLRYFPYKIYGIFDKGGDFAGFTTDPLFGFHYHGEHLGGRTLCLGDLQFENPTSIEELELVCKEIIKLFRIVNMQSLGSMYFPDRYKQFKNLGEIGVLDFVDSKLIEKIDYFGEKND